MISDASSHTHAIQIFEKRNDYVPGGANLLSNLAGGGGTLLGEQLGDCILHLFSSVAKKNDLAADLNDFPLIDQKSQRLLKVSIL